MSDDKRGSSNEPSWLYEENDNTLEEKLVTEVNSNNNNTNNDNDDSIFDKSKTYTGSSSTNNKDKYSSGRVPSTEQKLKWKKPSTESLNFSYSNNINSADYEDCCCCPSDPVLLWFRFFHFVSTIISIATLISNITIITKPEITPIDIIMHVYAMLFCIAIIFIEIDWRFVMDRVRVMDLWMFRGLFYCFVGIITGKYGNCLVACADVFIPIIVAVMLTIAVTVVVALRNVHFS